MEAQWVAVYKNFDSETVKCFLCSSKQNAISRMTEIFNEKKRKDSDVISWFGQVLSVYESLVTTTEANACEKNRILVSSKYEEGEFRIRLVGVDDETPLEM